MSEDGEKYSFVVEWYDSTAALVRKYTLTFYTWDSSVEMYDPKNHRMFLRRAKVDNVRLADMFIGNSLNVMGRQLTFIAYADDYTRRRLGAQNEKTLVMIKPDGMCQRGKIFDMIMKAGLQITNLKMCFIDRDEASEFYSHLKSHSIFSALIAHVTSGPILALELKGENTVQKFLDILGPTDCNRARECFPTTIRARFGSDSLKNACHGSETSAAAATELEFFFPSAGGVKRRNTACFTDSTCGIIKPHVVMSGQAGEVIDKIEQCGFEISAMMMLYLEKANAEEFLEVYKGVVQEYPAMVTELCSGPCIAIEVRAQNASQVFREFVGPADPEIARHIRPRTLRALFGKSKSQNAVHCTDLPEDSILEVEYFFKILDR